MLVFGFLNQNVKQSGVLSLPTFQPEDIMDYGKNFTELVSAVSQEPLLFGCSIRENILYGLPEDHPAPRRTEN